MTKDTTYQKEFHAQFNRSLNKLDKSFDKTYRNILVKGALRIRRESPVDTGLFKSNWVVSRNGPFVGTMPLGTRSDLIMRNKLMHVRFGETVYFTNNLKYAQPLADGWSSQAAAGWIDRAFNSMTGDFQSTFKVILR